MKFLSLEPFVPSGENFEGSKQLFLDLGFTINWDAGDYVGYERDGCKFILQRYNNKEFAENLMINVKIESATDFWDEVQQKGIAEKYEVRLRPPAQQPYGKEVVLTDIAGVCWHFVE